MPLTPREREALVNIRAAIASQGFGPTIRELGKMMGMRSPGAVHRLVKALEQKGYLKRGGHRPVMAVRDEQERENGGDHPVDD